MDLDCNQLIVSLMQQKGKRELPCRGYEQNADLSQGVISCSCFRAYIKVLTDGSTATGVPCAPRPRPRVCSGFRRGFASGVLWGGKKVRLDPGRPVKLPAPAPSSRFGMGSEVDCPLPAQCRKTSLGMCSSAQEGDLDLHGGT